LHIYYDYSTKIRKIFELPPGMALLHFRVDIGQNKVRYENFLTRPGAWRSRGCPE
jgi:hypothetical protein